MEIDDESKSGNQICLQYFAAENESQAKGLGCQTNPPLVPPVYTSTVSVAMKMVPNL